MQPIENTNTMMTIKGQKRGIVFSLLPPLSWLSFFFFPWEKKNWTYLPIFRNLPENNVPTGKKKTKPLCSTQEKIGENLVTALSHMNFFKYSPPHPIYKPTGK